MTTNEAEILLKVVDATIFQEFFNHNPYIDFGRARYALKQPTVVTVKLYVPWGAEELCDDTACWHMHELMPEQALGDILKIIVTRTQEAIARLMKQRDKMKQQSEAMPA